MKIETNYECLYINGNWIKPSNDTPLNVVNPATEEICAKVPKGSVTDIEKAINAARNAFDSWSVTQPKFRSDLILSIAEKMEERIEDLTYAISITMGCPIDICREIQVKGAIEGLRSFHRKPFELLTDSEENDLLFKHEPIGVCTLISPWNYPLSQLIGKVGPALAAGCTMIVKPAEQTPLQDFIMAEIFDEVGLPAGVFNLVSGEGPEIGPIMCSHPEVDMVSFTGSTQSGVLVTEAAAPTIKRVCLELGGKSPFIITKEADLEKAVRWGVEDVMINSGQSCNAHTRMFIHQDQYDTALHIAKEVAEENTVGNPLHEGVTMGPLASAKQKEAVISYIEKGIYDGARLVTGGIEMPKDNLRGAYVKPTIFADVNKKMSIVIEEIFGPVLCIIPYNNIEEAIQEANNSIYGLSSSVYAKDKEQALTIANRLRAGQCFIQGSFFNINAPFGGYKQSGNGREWGNEGLSEFLERKVIIG